MTEKGKVKARPAKKTAAKNKTKAGAAAVKGKKRNNLLKLCNEMGKYVIDANDKEIIKRFKTTITSATEDDISKTRLDIILKTPKEVVINEYSEGIQPYIKHYLFMIKRKKKP